MISVTVYKNRNNEYTGFTCKGHAGYDDYGKDIVCACVSMLVINTINSIEQFTDCVFNVDSDEDSGYIKLELKESITEQVGLLLDSMVLGISNTEQQYGKTYVKLKIKEV